MIKLLFSNGKSESGVTSITQRGLREAEVKAIAEIMNLVATAPEDENNLANCKKRAQALIAKFPLYKVSSPAY